METTTEKVQSLKFNSRRNVVSDGAFLTDDGRLFDACAKATWGGTVASVERGYVSRTQTASSIDIRCPEKAPSKVRRRCSMKTAVGQNAFRRSQPMELMEQ